MAATEPTAVMEGSEFDKAYVVVNAMFEEIARAPGKHSGKSVNYETDKSGSQGDTKNEDYSKEASVPERASSKESFKSGNYFIRAKDSDFILIDPLKDDDENAAILSKIVSGAMEARRKAASQEDRRQMQELHPVPPPYQEDEDGEGDHDVAATEDSMEDEDPGNQGSGTEEEDRGEKEEAPVRYSRAKERDSREVDDDDEAPEDDEDQDHEAPLEGAPVTEDLDDFAPETFMPPTVLGVARHYKVGSSFSVLPVHIPNAPEHVDLGTGVPNESLEEDDPEEEGEKEQPSENEENGEEGQNEDEDMEPHATTSSHLVISIEPSSSEHDEEDAPVAAKKGEDEP